jgi:DNA-binding NtrC family response regulator
VRDPFQDFSGRNDSVMAETGLRLVGVSAQMREIEDEIKRAARSDAKILVTGESGVGKEVVARLLHRHSARNGRPFVAMNCAGVPDSLLESELFGHVRGSFTGAYRDKPGLLEQAHGGTMFMDEVGEMSLRMQALLLRFLEDGDIQRVGSERRTGTANVRIVAATNRVLLDQIAAGAFREDLYYRLNVIHLVIPPLRARRDDVEPLLQYFLEEFGEKYGVPVPALAPEVVAQLIAYDWPGNVRELKNVVERLIVRGRGGVVQLVDLPGTMPGTTLSRALTAAQAGAAPTGTGGFPGGTATGIGAGESGSGLRANVSVGSPGVLPGTHVSSAAQLFERMISQRESFWSAVYLPFMARDLTRDDVRALVTSGLQHTRGNYKMLLALFNMEPTDYKRFLNFLRKHQCHMPFQHFRVTDAIRPPVDGSKDRAVAS